MARTEPYQHSTSPPSPLSFRTSGFPQYGCKAGFQVAPARAQAAARGLPPPFVLPARPPNPRTVSRGAAPHAPPCARIPALPQGPSLRSRLCCPGPSSLNRPHPPHSQTPRDFTAQRLIRRAVPRPKRLGGPRAVPCFRCRSVPTCRPHRPRGVRRLHAPSSFTGDTGLRPLAKDSALPSTHHPCSVGCVFEAVLVRTAATCRLARLPGRIRPNSRLAAGDLYDRASDGSVTLPAAGYDYGGNWASSTGGTRTRWNVS